MGSTITDNIGTSFLVTCGRDHNVCTNAIINCSQGMDCEVDCHSKDKSSGGEGSQYGCSQATITGPIGYNLRVECDDDTACPRAIIRGQDSSFMNLTCRDSNGCEDITFYCPPNTNGNKNCLLTGI